jgi:hypothetical protein
MQSQRQQRRGQRQGAVLARERALRLAQHGLHRAGAAAAGPLARLQPRMAGRLEAEARLHRPLQAQAQSGPTWEQRMGRSHCRCGPRLQPQSRRVPCCTPWPLPAPPRPTRSSPGPPPPDPCQRPWRQGAPRHPSLGERPHQRRQPWSCCVLSHRPGCQNLQVRRQP